VAKYSKGRMARHQPTSAARSNAKRDQVTFRRATESSEGYLKQFTPGRAFQARVETFEESNGCAASDSEPPVVKVFDTFEGYVSHVQDDTAYVTLQTQLGEEFHGEYPASELEAIGIYENRRFTLQTREVGKSLELRFAPIADLEIPPEVDKEISDRISNLVAGCLLDADD
jgi:hypothetical protein